MPKNLQFDAVLSSLKITVTEIFKHVSSLEKQKIHLGIKEDQASFATACTTINTNNLKSLNMTLDKIYGQLKQINHTIKLTKYNYNIRAPKKNSTRFFITALINEFTKDKLITKKYSLNYAVKDDFLFFGSLIYFKLIIIEVLQILTKSVKNYSSHEITVQTQKNENDNTLLFELCLPEKIFNLTTSSIDEKKFVAEFKPYQVMMQAWGINLNYQTKKSEIGIIFQFPVIKI